MKYALITVENNYADEFDVEGFGLFKGEELEQALKLLNSLEEVENQEIYFGTNEQIFLHDTTFCVKELTEEEYRTIQSVLGDSYGILDISSVLSRIESGMIFIEERKIFTEYFTELSEKAKANNLSYFEFIRELENLKDFTYKGVHFYRHQYDGEYNFTTEKEFKGDVYSITFDIRDRVEFF
ncbi:hypothetical protein [Providencia phage PSTCR5]|uniref:Antirestriction protein n=1 Tax=Providencia phage PSTCR5 TaxID=2783547 RepID=A0A873WHZ5_9CAUD|nr:hypothetical protein KNV68_gp145 [Providencia phage PSTCR5]QPB12213.1 hypothetical protein [Providencia phage PSTCR5]